MPRNNDELSGITLLGNQNTKYKFKYDPTILEKFVKKFDNIQDEEQIVSLDCFEFQSKCPKTGQPDFATIHISYIPGDAGLYIESKSLKLYLFSFQDEGSFHESCVHTIMEDLVRELSPKYLEVYGDFNSRGGICITPISIYADKEHQEMKRARQLAMMQYAVEHRPRNGGC
ncbi:MAG: preQ(1) synthase [Bacteroidaceae bacterium]|nr:preQ(1) synthase [Bacteroidaceae bacterium]